MGVSVRSSFNSKEDQTQRISKSVFVTNFPDHFSARDLWNVCMAYGNVIDVFIPFKRSKSGKKFAFVHFIRADKLKRLIENLNTIWIGRLRLHANAVRFQSEPKINVSQPKSNELQPNRTYVGFVKNMGANTKTFASVLNRGNPNIVVDSSPAIVLNEDCLVDRDFSCSLMGKIKDINALPNLYLILSNEGFDNVKLTHLGGLWVLLDMAFNRNQGVWLLNMLVLVHGLPIKVMTHNTFSKIVSSWGELTNVEDYESTTLSYKRLCVKVRPNVIIDDMVKIIVKGKIYWIRVKEQETWSPKFIEEKDEDSQSGEETDDEKENDNGNLINDYENDNDLEKNELDHVSESSCMHDHNHHASKRSEHPINSDDPFEIYKILEKNNDKGGVEKNKGTVEVESTDPQFPLGFTPDVGQANAGKAKLAHDSQ
ncbi:RNA-directed DNA polymerase, eukaryota, partial [Tanacetum coccineum]